MKGDKTVACVAWAVKNVSLIAVSAIVCMKLQAPVCFVVSLLFLSSLETKNCDECGKTLEEKK